MNTRLKKILAALVVAVIIAVGLGAVFSNSASAVSDTKSCVSTGTSSSLLTPDGARVTGATQLTDARPSDTLKEKFCLQDGYRLFKVKATDVAGFVNLSNFARSTNPASLSTLFCKTGAHQGYLISPAAFWLGDVTQLSKRELTSYNDWAAAYAFGHGCFSSHVKSN